ncbi:MAG: LPS export ABC transporter periplasmic protein LptC [Ancalomicrobiaceae bacterium]|nr:LPS export ABC transporter periplasmic protein LptC [Ancalomicrobiaceae bacterium]
MTAAPVSDPHHPPGASAPNEVNHLRLHERRPIPPSHAQAKEHDREAAKRQADRHSRRVRWMKVGLPIAGVAVAGAVVVRTLIYSFVPGLDMPAVLFSRNGLTMVEPHLSGRSRDRTYDITADRAMQNFSDTKSVQLEGLTGRIEMNDGSWAKVTAKTGLYDGNHDALTLKEAIEATTSTGYVLKTDSGAINLSTGDMSTDSPVRIEGPAGTIESKGARVSDNGKLITFIGGVHAVIKGNALPLPPDDAPANQSATAPGVQP